MKKNNGFTLLEVILVLILISLSFSLVSPSLGRFTKGIELKGSAQKIAGILRSCRTEAVQKGQIYQILFNLETHEINVRTLQGRREGGTHPTWIEKTKYSLPPGIKMQDVGLAPLPYPTDSPAIEFYPTGNSNGGQITLENQLRQGYRIKVHFLTGIIEVERL